MDKKEIIALLEVNHQQLFDWFNKQDNEKWMFAPEMKWTVGQHFLHLLRSIELLNQALNYPKFILENKFGRNYREGKDYKTIVKNYQNKLAENKDIVLSFNRNLRIPKIADKNEILTSLQIQSKKLQYKTNKISDENLDELLIPHPLMGKMTIREIIMWTAYHTSHHFKILEEKY
jgi:uncharacterized damage-inducible protein DinB